MIQPSSQSCVCECACVLRGCVCSRAGTFFVLDVRKYSGISDTPGVILIEI